MILIVKSTKMHCILPYNSIHCIENWIFVNNFIHYSNDDVNLSPVVLSIPFSEDIKKNNDILNEIQLFHSSLNLNNNNNNNNIVLHLKKFSNLKSPIKIKFKPIINHEIQIEII